MGALSWIALIVVAASLALGLYYLRLKSILRKENAQSAAESRLKKAIENESRVTATRKKRSFFAGLDSNAIHCHCVVNNSAAVLSFRNDWKGMSFLPFSHDLEFNAGEKIEFPFRQILSVELQHNERNEKFYRTESVPVSATNKRSPVARAIVGGVLLGPAGMVVGAASGLGGTTKITSEERRVTDNRIVRGRPIR